MSKCEKCGKRLLPNWIFTKQQNPDKKGTFLCYSCYYQTWTIERRNENYLRVLGECLDNIKNDFDKIKNS